MPRALQSVHEGALAPETRHWLVVLVVAAAITPVPEVAYKAALLPVIPARVVFWPEATVTPALAVIKPPAVTVPMLVRFLEASRTVVPFNCTTVDAPPKLTLLVVVVRYVEEIVPMLAKFPLESIL